MKLNRTNPLFARFFRRSSLAAATVVTLAGFAAVPAARAATQVWNISAPTNNWNLTDASWDTSALWTNGNDASFTGADSPTLGTAAITAGTITVTGTGELILGGYLPNLSFTTLNVNTTAGGKLNVGSAYNNLNGGSISIASGATVYDGVANIVSGAITVTGTGNTENRGALRLESGAVFSGPITLAGTTVVGSGSTGILSGVISDGSGTYGLTSAGTGGGTIILTGANTFKGPVSIPAGIFQVNSLNSVVGGVASSGLGAPTSVINGTIGLSGTGQGTLLYAGAGETTDRVINFANANGGVITQNGAGTLTFSSNMTGAAAGMGITINGAGVGQMKGITNTTALLNFNKSGTGKWTVTGNLTLNAGNIRPQGGVLAFSSTATTTGTAIISGRSNGGVLDITTGASIITSTANTNGILGGWATVDKNTWAVTNGAIAINGLLTFATDTWAAGSNTDVTVVGANPASGATTNSLRFNAAGAKTLTLAGIDVVSSGGILETTTVGANATTITGGTLTCGNITNPGGITGATAGDLFFHQYNASASGSLTVASVIANYVPATRTGTVTTSAKTVPGLSSTTDLVVGMTVTGTGIAASSTIASVDSATQITLNNTPTTAGSPTLTFGSVANGLTKVGAGTLTLTGANTYTGTTYVNEGKVQVNATAGGTKTYNVSNYGTLEINQNSVATNITVNGAGTAATTGVYFKTTLQQAAYSSLTLQSAPTTVRGLGTAGTAATFYGYDTNSTYITLAAAASGSVLDPQINISTGSYGYPISIAAGPNTATGDLEVQGKFTGATGATGSVNYRKTGAGSLLLSGQSSAQTTPWQIWDGSVILGGGADRIGTGAGVQLGNGSTSGKLVLKGNNQTLANLTSAGTGTVNKVVNGSTTLATLTLSSTSAVTFPAASTTATLGGFDTNENNLALAKAGSGTFTLGGTNTYTGGTTITAGTLSLGSTGALGTTGAITMNGGTLQFTASNSTDYTVGGRLKLADGTISSFDTNGLSIAFANALAVGSGGTGGLGKAGAGTLTISANQTFTGGTTVTAGSLVLDYSTANGSKLSDSGQLTLAGGTLTLSGGSHQEIVGSTQVTGISTITRSSGTATISLGNITRTSTNTLNIAADNIALTTLSNDGSGKLPSWITVAGLPSANDGAGNIITYSGYYDITRFGGTIPNNPLKVLRIIDGTTGLGGDITPTASGITDISDLNQNATSGPVTVTLGLTDTLRIGATGTILVPVTSGSLTIQNGFLTAGGANNIAGMITADISGTATINSAITNNGTGVVSLVKQGTGSLSLAGNNSYTGGTTLTNGQLNLNSATALGSTAALLINGGSLDNTSGSPVSLSTATTQNWNTNFTFAGSSDLNLGTGAVTLGANRQVTVTANTLTVGGVVSGAYTLTKAGAGAMVLSGINSYSGATTVNAGMLEAQAGVSGIARAYTVASGATLKLGYSISNGVAWGGGCSLTVNGVSASDLSGLYLNGGTVQQLGGTLTLQTAASTVRGYGSGSVTLNGGDVNNTHLWVKSAASGSAFASAITLGGISYGYRMNIESGANTATGDLTINGALTGSSNGGFDNFRKEGAGSLRLTGTSTYGTGFDVYQGSLILGANGCLPASTYVVLGTGTNSAKLVLDGVTQTLTAVNISGTGNANAIVGANAVTTASITIANTADLSYGGFIGGAGTNENNLAIGKSGAGILTLTGANTYAGGTTVNAGTLTLGSAGAVGSSGTITMNGGTLQFTAANTTDYTATSRLKLADGMLAIFDTNGLNVGFANAFVLGAGGTGGLDKIGAGTLTLSANQAYSGNTVVNAGALVLDYSTADGSKLSDSGQLTLGNSTLTLNGGTHQEIVGNTLVTGTAQITRPTGTAMINLGAITRSGSATLNIAADNIAITSLTNDISGKLPSWITVNGQPAANNGAGNIVAYSGFVPVVRLGGLIPSDPTYFVKIVDGGVSGDVTPAATGLTDLASLLQSATSGPAVVTLGVADTLRLGATGTIEIPSGAGQLTIQNGVLTAGGATDTAGTIAVDASAGLTIASTIANNGAGAVSLSKIGSAALTLTGNNTFTGTTTLNVGTLNINSATALGTSAFSVTGGTLDNTSGAAITVAIPIAQTWNSDITFTGTNNLTFSAGSVTLPANRIVTVSNGMLDVAGLNGAYTLGKAGAGNLTVASGNWSGATTVSAGTLEVNGKTNDVVYTVASGATLKVGYTTGGAYANTGLTITGDGTAATTGFYLTGSAGYNASGGISLIGAPTTIRHEGAGTATLGTFDVNGDGITTAFASSGSVIDSGIQIVSRGFGMSVNTAAGNYGATGDLVINGQLNVGSLGLHKRGAGSLALNGAATTGNLALKIQAGTVITGIANAVGANADLQISSGAKLVLNGFSQAAGTLSDAGKVVNGSASPAVLTIKQAADAIFSGTLGGSGTNENNFELVKTGSAKLTLTGANSYTGNTTVNQGTLSLALPILADTADVYINNSTTTVLNLTTGTTDTVHSLYVDGVIQPAGVYGATGSGAKNERAFITGSGTLTVTTGAADYKSWEIANGIAGAGATADSNHNGIPNGIEYVIGGNPSGTDSGSYALLPTITTDDTYLNFVFRRTAGSAAYNPGAQYGSDLAGWIAARNGVDGVIVTEVTDGFSTGVDRVTVQIPRTLAAPGTKLFARLMVVITP